jgi:hypothetical protein
MYEYMSWHVLLACTVDMCCTDCIVPFLHFRRGNLNNMGTVGNGEGESGGGGIERVQHLVSPGPGGGRGGGAYRGVCRLPHTL